MRVKTEMDNDDKGVKGDMDQGCGRQNSPQIAEKLFVGGLSWETTQETLQRYFSRYGEVIDCVVMKNSESGRSRGFGFVTFSDPANVSLVLQNGPHQLDGRTIDPKPCNPRSLQKPKRSNSYPKVFLGGLPSNITETDLRTYFTRFGKVMEVVIMYDQEKKKSRGFGFLSFEDDEAVDRCVAEHFVNLNGKQVEIKKAEPRDSGKMGDGPPGQWGPPQGGPPMGMGGGMGMGGPNGQMGGPMGGPMGPMGPPGNMMQGYQGWGTPPQTTGYPGHWGPSPSNQPPVNAGYGTPSGPGGYQGWGAPPGPQGQQMPPPQWGSNYGGPPQQQGYGSYGDMYSRGSAPGPTATAPAAPAAPGGSTAGQQKSGSEYGGGYSSYSGYQDSSSYTAGRNYAGDGTSQTGGGYSGHPPVPGQGDTGVASSSYTGGPGPQRGGNYSQPSQAPSFHPYRRM
ncbi:heterogeneous nuclear ribonucleoprotein 27C isoform X9 [Zootermopsis nevadensis]|uniref:heterogeneous nuclear ribonucleoprotein 27C isoform X9 n=1 Tax=Zootermopsis nevadensis TaxID=136037 RepID=UPI000B8EDAC6|nr:heterogeneous nuclear ribonucleoprotein 27C isoform X9 [Zootermopsis nevadensis]